MFLDITAVRGQELFEVPFTHTRLFFPEEYGVVLHVDEYAKQQQEANVLKWEAKEAKKYGLSLEEYRSQREYLEKANKDKKAHRPKQTGGEPGEERAVAGVGTFKKNEKDKMSESMMHIEHGKPLSEGRRQEQERMYELARQQSQHDGSDQTGYEVIEGEEVKTIDNNYLHVDIEPQPVLEGKPHHEEKGYKSLPSPDGKYHQRPSPDTNRRSPDPPAGRHDHHYHRYPPGGSSDHYSSGVPPPLDPHHQFTIGSMVCIDVQRGDPLYGVVKWIGTVPDFPYTIAGVEMVIIVII